MGDIVKENSEKVESISLTETFEKFCPFFISIGMSYEQFWDEDPTITKTYYEAYKMKMEREIDKIEWQMWKQGVYIYEALVDVSPILHAFAKKGTKALPYPKEPYSFKDKKTEEQKQKEAENERLRAMINFNNWCREMNKKFKNEGGG